MVLGVVLELLRDDGVTEEELERGEDVLARGRKGLGRGELLREHVLSREAGSRHGNEGDEGSVGGGSVYW